MLGRLLSDLLRQLTAGKRTSPRPEAQVPGENPLAEYFFNNPGRLIHKWHHYFDIYHRCRSFEDEATTILIGDQGDRRFLAEVRGRVPHIDILIDDGGHKMAQQITTFEELYPHVQPDGIYLCEDIHTSFMPEFGGGYRREGTFLEYGKALIDRLYGWYSRDHTVLPADEFTRATYALHFYDSVLVIEKSPKAPPQTSFTGTPSFLSPCHDL